MSESSKRSSGLLVAVLMGSSSDSEQMQPASDLLEEMGIGHEVVVVSAHRSPEKTAVYAREAAQRGIRVLIVGAGRAAHLAGAVAANTNLPVLGVPLDSGSLRGMDALLSTVQMPKGVPVATFAIGSAGAANAAIFAAQILALSDPALAARLERRKQDQAEAVPGTVRTVDGCD